MIVNTNDNVNIDNIINITIIIINGNNNELVNLKISFPL